MVICVENVNIYFSKASIAGAIAALVAVGSKRSTTLPSLLIRNLVKFHLIEGVLS